MSFFELVASLVESLAWPAVTLVVAVMVVDECKAIRWQSAPARERWRNRFGQRTKADEPDA